MDPAANPLPATQEVTITPIPPTPEELIYLRGSAGLTPPPPSTVSHALAHSVHVVTARLPPSATHPNGAPIGMVRCIGDGALFLQLVDMCVLPEHQGKGVGKRVLDAMLAWIDENTPDAYLSLIGDPPGQALYKSRGFVASRGIGMKRSKWGH
jgi:GNAT superfamily N-acetyltransferase